MTKEEIEELISQVTWNTTDMAKGKGGQHVARLYLGITLEHEELGFKVTIGNSRSQLKNREIAMNLFKQFLLEINK